MYQRFSEARQYLISVLGSPYYETEECILFCGDTLAMQKEIEISLFDTIITSPPYNIGKEYEKILWYVKNPKEYTFHLDAIRDKNVKYPNSKKTGG